MANAKRTNGFLESNMEELETNDWLIVVYIPGDMNTSGGLTKAAYSDNMRGLLTHNTSRIVTEERDRESEREREGN